MPLDMTGQPDRPQVDRDAVALALQRELGRPLAWSEYVRIWNVTTDKMGRSDFIRD
ncbi:hypothetical protein [uncultured Shimia sp.]|uniref:hypothetical protein n=1 Tax=uncultured Shimia sp. TaxID=573152 RepID=UPI00260AEA21|nr:hypothetical protein [uncultured Shimia sp.]